VSGCSRHKCSNVDKIINNGHNLLLQDTDRSHLVKLYHDLGYRVGAEIGAGGGVFSEMICQTIPGVKLYAIDAWVPYDGYVDFQNEAYLEDDYKRTVEKLKPFDATIIRKFSMDAVKQFEDGSLDFVYIDANHEAPYVEDDIRAWSKKVRPGGMVSGHDYANMHQAVIEAVDKYAQRPLFLVGDPKEGGDNALLLCSWLWIVP